MLFYKETNDNWYDSFKIEGNTNKTFVKVSMHQSHAKGDPGLKYRVLVNGNDNYGYSKIFENEQDALLCYARLSMQKSIEIEDLRTKGFIFD